MHRLAFSAAIAAVPAFHLFVFGPLYMMAGNEGRATLSVADIVLGWPMLMAIGATVAIGGVLWLCLRSGLSRPAAVVSALGIYLLVAFYLIHTSLPLLDGASPNFESMVPLGIAEATIGIIVLGVALLKPVIILGLPTRLLLIMFGAWSAMALWQVVPPSLASEGASGSTAANPNFFRDATLADVTAIARDNVIVILIDTLQGDIFEDVTNANETIRDQFEGFTHFSNVTGVFPFTGLSVPAILTGQAYRPEDETIPEYQKRVAKQRLSAAFEDAGMAWARLPLETRPDFLNSDSRKCRAYGDIFDVFLYRQAPALLKGTVFDEDRMQFSRRCAEGNIPAIQPEVDLAVFEKITSLLHVDGEGAKFTFLHLWGAHPPANLSANCEVLDTPNPDIKALVEQSVCALSNVGDYMDRLRELGVFETSMVFVVSDHGTRQRFLTGAVPDAEVPDFIRSGGYPTIALHAPGDQEPLKTDDRAVSLMDIYATVASEFRFPSAGGGMDIRTAPKERVREYTYFKSAEEFYQDRLTTFTRFSILGDVRDPLSWTRKEGGSRSNEPLRLVDLGSLGAETHLGIGWSSESSSVPARWTVANPASIYGTLPAGDLITMKIRFMNPHPGQVVTISSGDQMIDELKFEAATGWIEHQATFEPANPGAPVTIDLRTKRIGRLSEADPRNLGVLVDWIRFDPAS